MKDGVGCTCSIEVTMKPMHMLEAGTAAKEIPDFRHEFYIPQSFRRLEFCEIKLHGAFDDDK
jgi:hypothetical protein